MNLADVLRHTAEATPDGPAYLEAESAAITYGHLDERADAVAGELLGRGIEPGKRVALLMGNTPSFAAAYFGVLRAGLVAVPLNPEATPREIRAVLTDCSPTALIHDGEIDDLKEPGIEAILDGARLHELASSGHIDPVGGDTDTAVLAYTSGTTGEPRGAMLTHANLLASLDQQQSIEGGKINAQDIVLVTTPLFHIFGLNVVLALSVRAGAAAVMPPRFDAATSLDLIERHRVSVLVGAPSMYRELVGVTGAEERDLSSIRLASSGAAPLPLEVAQAFESTFEIPIYEAYGLTETSPSLTSNRMQGSPKRGSVGKPLPGVELKIVGDDFEEVEPGDPGEVVVRGPNVFSGYWNRPEDSKAAFTDGWFHTGDVGVMDEDGYLFLVDRMRELIIVSGFNVFPSEVESVLASHPSVAEAAVIGEPNPNTGESVLAYVVVSPGGDLDEGDLQEHVASNLARFKRPARIEFVKELPHLATGKVLKRALRT